MVRKSERNKRATPDKTSSPRKSTRSTRRRKKSTSESEPEPDIPVEIEIKHDNQKPETSDAHTRLRRSTRVRNTPDTEDKVETPPEVPVEDKTFWESQTAKVEETPTENNDEGTTWKVQSSNGSGGEIQKLKICRQRLTDSAESSSSPAKESLSPRRKRYTKRATKGDKHEGESAESTSSPTDSEALTQSETPEPEIQFPSETENDDEPKVEEEKVEFEEQENVDEKLIEETLIITNEEAELETTVEQTHVKVIEKKEEQKEVQIVEPEKKAKKLKHEEPEKKIEKEEHEEKIKKPSKELVKKIEELSKELVKKIEEPEQKIEIEKPEEKIEEDKSEESIEKEVHEKLTKKLEEPEKKIKKQEPEKKIKEQEEPQKKIKKQEEPEKKIKKQEESEKKAKKQEEPEKKTKKSSELEKQEKRVKKPSEPEELEENKSVEESSHKTSRIELSTEIDEKAMEEIAKKLNERAAAKGAKEAPEENKKSEVKKTEINDDNDKKPEETTELDTSREEGEISSAAPTPEPKQKIIINKDSSVKTALLKRDEEPIQRKRRVSSTEVDTSREEGEISSAAPTPEPKHKTTIIINKQDSSVKPAPLKRLLEEEPSQRKRRISKQIKPQKESQIVISSLTLKTLVPDVAPVPLEEVKELLTIDEEMKKVGSERKRSHHDSSEEPGELVSESMDYERSLSPESKRRIKDPTEEPNTPEEKIQDENEEVKEPKKKIIIKHTEKTDNIQENHKTTRKISIVSDDAKTLRRSPSPSAKKATNVLYITNLVRPFTVTQLKDLLARTGTLAENGFFIDKIKSKCYVKYTSVEMAVETRQALHGVRWPFNNPKTLKVDYSNEQNLNVMLRLAEEEHSAAIKQEVAAIDRNSDKLEKELKEALIEKTITKPTSRRVTTSVREWDMGKMAGVENHTQNQVAEDDKKIEEWGKKDKNKTEVESKRRIHSPENAELPRKMKKKDTEAPAKLLDGLFRKTKATPCIYWLPLTTAQIAVKEEMRRQHMAKHERRLAEQRKTDSRHDKGKDIIIIKGRDRDREKERERDIDKDKRKK